jgi:hypothetical protein
LSKCDKTNLLQCKISNFFLEMTPDPPLQGRGEGEDVKGRRRERRAEELPVPPNKNP